MQYLGCLLEGIGQGLSDQGGDLKRAVIEWGEYGICNIELTIIWEFADLGEPFDLVWEFPPGLLDDDYSTAVNVAVLDILNKASDKMFVLRKGNVE